MIAIERWRCTMAAAQALALPAALAKVAAVLGLSEQKGDKSIVPLMAKPRRPRSDEDPAAGPYWFDDSEHLQTLYCLLQAGCRNRARAVSAAAAAVASGAEALGARSTHQRSRLLLRRHPDRESDRHHHGRRSRRASRAEAAHRRRDREHQPGRENHRLAGGARLRRRRTCRRRHCRRRLRRTDLAPEVRRVIELRREAAHASANKFQALRAWRCLDGRVRGAFKFHGAATGRWSGSGPQPQNFRRESEDTASKFAAVMSGNLEAVRQLGAPIEIVGDIARAAICAPPGYRLLIGDFGGIESRVLAWIADQHDKVAQWAKFDRTQDPNDDPYVVIGRALGHPEADARPKGKIADLAFGYQGGARRLREFRPER